MKASLFTAFLAVVARTNAQASSSSTDGKYHGVNAPGPGDHGYVAPGDESTVRITTGLALDCKRPGQAAAAAEAAADGFRSLYHDTFEKVDHGGRLACLDVVCAAPDETVDTVIVLVDLELAPDLGSYHGVNDPGPGDHTYDQEQDDGGWKDHADRRRLDGHVQACAKVDDGGWTDHTDRRRLEADASEVCVEKDGGGWTRHEDRRLAVCSSSSDGAPGTSSSSSGGGWTDHADRRLQACVTADEALAAFEAAAVQSVTSGAFGKAFLENFKRKDVDKVSGPGDVGFHGLEDCAVDTSSTIRMMRASEAAADAEGQRGGGGGGGGSKKSSGGSDDEIVAGVIIAVIFLLILALVLWCCRGRAGSKAPNSSCASACAADQPEVKLGPKQGAAYDHPAHPGEKEMIRSYEMARATRPEERKEDVGGVYPVV